MIQERTPKEASLEQEDRIAKIFGGQRTPRSGGGAWKLGDVTTDDMLFECKTTVKPSLSYSVNKTVLDKANQERAEMHKDYYALAFTLGENFEDYFVLDRRAMKDFVDMRNGIKKLIEDYQSQLDFLDKTYHTMKNDNTLSENGTALYNAHRTEIFNFIEVLRKL